MAVPLLSRSDKPSGEVPGGVADRLQRGRERLSRDIATRNVCFQFFRGETYSYVDDDGKLRFLPTSGSVRGQGKPPHRVRTRRNLIAPVVRHEVSYATQRVPSYQVDPATSDPEDIAAARMAEKVALYGYDRWRLREATVMAVTHAVVGDEAFAWPYWDSTVGPFVAEPDPETGQPLVDEGGTPRLVGLGEVRVRIFGANECYWEPGLRFEDSPWHAVEQARNIDDVMGLEGYLGGKLKPDVQSAPTAQGEKQKQARNLVMVTDYLERPSPRNPRGRWLTVAGGRVILPPRPYPTPDGELALHKLTYMVDPDSDRDIGLVRHLLDAVRTYQDAVNKICEWKNQALNPQVLAPRGSMRVRPTDAPGDIVEFDGSAVPQWRPVPPIPGELFSLLEVARREIGEIAAQNDIPEGVEAARAIQVLIERDQNARQAFLANLADWHSRVMRHCLQLVQQHYTEPRLLKIRGRFGPERVEDFKGSVLRDQVDVRVFPDSIEPRTRQAIEQKVQTLFQLGLITPEQALAGLNGGTGERLVDSYELDVERANAVIQKIKSGPDVLSATPPLPDGSPGWMPRKGIDNPRVHRQVVADWAKTQDFEMLDAGMQEAAYLYLQACEQLIAEEEAQQAAAQARQAEGLGLQNAARPQPKPLPSLPKPQ